MIGSSQLFNFSMNVSNKYCLRFTWYPVSNLFNIYLTTMATMKGSDAKSRAIFLGKNEHSNIWNCQHIQNNPQPWKIKIKFLKTFNLKLNKLMQQEKIDWELDRLQNHPKIQFYYSLIIIIYLLSKNPNFEKNNKKTKKIVITRLS